MSKVRFLGRFLLGFAAILTAWSLTPAAEACTAAVLAVASGVGPVLHGWTLVDAPQDGAFPRWVSGPRTVELRIHFDALAVGVVPLLALIAATPGMPARRRLRAALLGSAGCLGIDALIVVLFPLLVHYENALTGVAGTFLGVIGFVGAPAILWFILARREIRAWVPSLDAPRRKAVDA